METEVENEDRYKCKTNIFLLLMVHYVIENFEETFQEFLKWICRLSKRIIVDDVNVKIKGFDKQYVIDDPDPFYNMSDFDKDNWCDYLMWKYDRDEDGNLLGGKQVRKNV